MGTPRVPVHYFPKRPRHPRRASSEAHSESAPAPTIEFRPDFAEEDRPTEPVLELPEEVRAELQATRSGSGRRRRTPPRHTRPAVQVRPPRGAKKERAKGRRITLEIDTDPALSYHVRKLDELLSSRSPTEPLRSMSRQELAEMSLFGHQLFQTGRLEEARVVFEGLVGLDIEDAFPHTMLGTVYLAMGRVDRAAALFEAALRIDPKDVAARVYRAELSLSQGELPRAVKALEAVVAEGPVSDPFVCRAQRLLEIARSGRRRK